MGVDVEYLHTSKSGRLAFRRAFPDELRPHVGKRELKVSLKTKLKREALSRYHEAAAEYDRLVSLARKKAAGTFDLLSEPQIAYLAESYAHARLHNDEISRFDPDDSRFELEMLSSFKSAPMIFMDGATRREKALAGIPMVLETLQAAYASGDPEALRDAEAENAEELLAEHGLRVDTNSPAFLQLCSRLLVVDIEIARKLLARFNGEPVPTPAAPQASPSKPSEAKASKEQRFTAIVEKVLTSSRNPLGVPSMQSTRTALRFFVEAVGDIPAHSITRRHVADWLDMYAQRPSKLPTYQRDWTLPRLVKHYAGKADVTRVSSKTLDVGVQALSARWNDAWKQGLLGSLSRDDNPFRHQNHQIAPIRHSENPGYSANQLNAIFSLPLFTAGERPLAGKGEASYWLPLILLFTGCRPEEAAQLLVADISEEEGRWCLRITDEGEHPTKGKRTLKTQRSGTGRRTFPVPQPLLDLGLLDYVQWLRSRGEKALFPSLKPTGQRQQLFAKFSEFWSAYLKEKKVALPPYGKPARDFRHTWTTFARASGINEEEREYIQGHSTAGKSANVGYGGRSPLGLAVDKLRFKGLDLSQVRKWSPPPSA